MVGNWALIYEPGGKDGNGRKVYLGILHPPSDLPDEREWFFQQFQANRIAREGSFRGAVLGAYDNYCAISHLPGLVNGGGRVELAAAHIKPVEYGGPDIVQNGF